MEQFRQKSAGMLDRPARQMARRLDETDQIVGTLRTISGAWTRRTVAETGIPPAYRNRRIIAWLTGWDDPTCRTVASVMWRCRLAGGAEARRRL